MLLLDCASFTSFSLILSKSRCPVLTAGLRIYLTEEYCMFNNLKKTNEKTKKIEKIEKRKWRKLRRKSVIYILKLHAQGWESHI